MRSRKNILDEQFTNGIISYRQHWEAIKAINDNRDKEWMPQPQDHNEAINFDLGL